MTVNFALRHTAAIAAALALVLGSAQPLMAKSEDAYWVSTSKAQANMRVGPGRDYRISWTYVRKGVPLKVLRVMGGWRLVEDKDGSRGWILQQFLSRERTAFVIGVVSDVREKKDGSGGLMWRVEPGVIGKLGECEADWCAFDIEGRKGFIRANNVWGAQKP